MGRGLRDARRERLRGAEGLAGALQHHSEVPRRRPQEAREAAAALGVARGVARARSLDFVLQINVIQSKKTTELLQFALALLEAQAAFFSQGQQRASSTQQYRGQLGAKLHQLVLDGARGQRDMEQRHALLMQQDLTQETVGGVGRGEGPDSPNPSPIEGYLNKRGSNAFRTWSRRWFYVKSNQLLYVKRAQDPPTVVVEDLRLCTVRPCPDLERRFCFEVVSPSKCWVLQADSAGQQRGWLCTLQRSIACAFGQGPPCRGPRSSSPGGPGSPCRGRGGGHPDPEVVATVLAVEGNGSCCDCRAPQPGWASVNLGITLCIECSGTHRSLGVHFSKVRSLTLDSWEPEVVKLMCQLGNGVLNRIYEARLEELGVKRPPPGCSRAQREGWIRAKYVHKRFLGAPQAPPPPRPSRAGSAHRPDAESPPAPPPPLAPGPLLCWGSQFNQLPAMAAALAHGADPNGADPADADRTPLLRAVAANSLLACEFLLQNGASVNRSDRGGRGPLHLATQLGHTGLACLLLKRGADANARDAGGRDPLSIALDSANADIVTLLRLAKMREVEVAQGQPGDDTYLDVVRDFSLMASDRPELLARPSPHKPSTL